MHVCKNKTLSSVYREVRPSVYGIITTSSYSKKLASVQFLLGKETICN
jgi:hypothetical protein